MYCVNVYVCVYMNVYVHVCVHISLLLSLSVCVCVCVCVCVYALVSVCMWRRGEECQVSSCPPLFLANYYSAAEPSLQTVGIDFYFTDRETNLLR